MKNVFFILTFFTLKTLFVLGQKNLDCYEIPLKDSSNTTLSKLYFKLIKKGHLIPTFNFNRNESRLLLEICPGEKINKIYIHSKNQKPINYSPAELGNQLENQFYELINNGYPFASIKVDSINFNGSKIDGKLNIQKGPFFKWGTLNIKGNTSINEKIVRGILDIKQSDPYNEDAFLNIENKLNQLSYITNFQKPELLFENGNVDLYIYINSKPINNISGTIGLQQNATTQNYFLIGDLKMKLANQLKRSETFDLQWRRIQQNTQSIKIGFNYPSLFKSNFGVDNQFSLYKKDTSFLELKNQFGLQYFSTRGFLLKANYKYLESNILNQKITNITSGKSINYFYGLSVSKQQLDYLPAPRKGYQFLIDISLGKRITSRSDSLKNKFDNTFKGEYQFIFYKSFLKRNIIRTYFSGEIYWAPFYYQNELLRFGGLTNQRGFREDELLGNIRFTQSLEYRFMIEQNSFLFAYYDLSYYENNLKSKLKDVPFGFGSGFSFGTPQGIFSISYAIGKQFNNPILLKNGIIHFGYISYF